MFGAIKFPKPQVASSKLYLSRNKLGCFTNARLNSNAPRIQKGHATPPEPSMAASSTEVNGQVNGKKLTKAAPKERPVKVNNLLDSLSSYATMSYDESSKIDQLTVVVIGGSGDLAQKKIIPSLFALFYDGHLPENFTIVGYARSDMTDEQYRELMGDKITCRVGQGERCQEKVDEFMPRLFYQQGQYKSLDDFAALDKRLDSLEHYNDSNRIFYLSVPPTVFIPSCQGVSRKASSKSGYTRVIVEKPFGRDLQSSLELEAEIKKDLTEEQIFRIDHYLGKELIENLSVLRFSNLVFEPLWSRTYIRNVQIVFSEDFGTQGRGGYFDQYGIIRDVVQNHLLQMMCLFAMERPVSLQGEDVRNEKVKLVRMIEDIKLDDVVVGQYKKRGPNPGYHDDPTVPQNSTCPTFAAMALFINNPRWDGVPFLIKAGKALNERRSEIRIQFRHVPGNLFAGSVGSQGQINKQTNELVMRIQPQEAIYLKINNKIPGMGFNLGVTKLDLSYQEQFKNSTLPDAYERLILDVINGDKRLFIRNDELEAAWKLFTPILQELESKKVQPELYPYGSRGPIGAHYLAAKHNVMWGDMQ